MNQLTVALMALACIVTLLDWRRGLAVCLIVGIAQDPLRKLAPNQPMYFVLLVGVVFAAAWSRAALARVKLGPSAIYGWRRNLQVPFNVFVVLVCLQAIHSAVRYGNLVMPGIGLLVWLAPVPAVILAYQFASRKGLAGVRTLMSIYVVAALVSLSGVYFEYAGYPWRTLGEIGEGQIIYDVGTVLKAHSGFYRASEIAAWHSATIACFVFMLFWGKRPTVLRLLMIVGFTAILVSLGILTGRRKMLVEITIFFSAYWFLVAWFQRGMFRLAMILLLIGITGYIVIVGFVAPDLVQSSYSKSMQLKTTQRMEGYAVRGQSVLADLPRRVSDFGVEPLVFAVREFGWVGAGLGTGSQGTNQIAEANNIPRWAAEGGLGKVAMELGVPGLIAALWLVISLAKYLRRQLAVMVQQSVQHSRMAFGLIAFLVANAATFSVATQAFSDLFILLILGWCAGFLLAMPALAASGDGIRRRPVQRAWRHSPLPPFAPTTPVPVAHHAVTP